MIPYVFASGHTKYARYGLVYFRSMEKMNGEVLEKFMNGEHVQRLKMRIWKGIWTDMYMETTFRDMDMGLKVSKFNHEQVWVLCLHNCSRLLKEVADMKNRSYKDDERRKR